MLRSLLVILLAVNCTACTLLQDRRDTPWDPRAGSGRALFDQIPNEDGYALKVCCGHLDRCQPHQSPRC